MFNFQQMLEDQYKRGFEAGITHQKNEQLEDAARRSEYLFDEGKRLGYEKGASDGFGKGYTFGYKDGVIAGKYEDVDEIDLDDLIEKSKEVTV